MMRLSLLCLISVLSLTACGANRKDNSVDIIENKDKMIIEAVERGKTEIVKTLLSQGANVETKDSQNRTLLMIATYERNIEMAKILVDAGANVNAQDNIKNSPFLYVGAEGELELLKLYLAHGADFKVFNRYGGSALIPAAEKGHIDVVRLLSQTKDFPIDHVNNLGWTALMEAVVLGSGGKKHTEIVQILVDAGCDVHIPDSDGVTALTHAQTKGFSKIVKILEIAANKGTSETQI